VSLSEESLQKSETRSQTMTTRCSAIAAGCISFGHKWRTGTGRQYFI